MNNYYYVIHLGFTFFLLFTTWSTTQILLSSILPTNIAYKALSMVYFSYSLSCFIAPMFIERLGIKTSLIIASISYSLFTLSIQFIDFYLVILISLIHGFFASILWISQGSYLTSLSKDTPNQIGVYTGTFWSIHFFSSITGHLLTQLIMLFTSSKGNILIILSIISFLSLFSFLFIKNVEKTESKQEFYRQKLFEMLKEMKYIIIFIIYEGISASFQSGVFTKQMEFQDIPKVMFFYGLTLLIGSYCWGKLFDRFGWKLLIGLNMIIHPFAYSLINLDFEKRIIAILLGMSDGINVNLMNSTISKKFKETSIAFALFKSIQSLSTSIGFYLCEYLTMLYFQFLVLGLLIIGTLLFYIWMGQEEKEEEIEI